MMQNVRSAKYSVANLKVAKLIYPDAPCMEYLPTFTPKIAKNVGKYSIHGASGICFSYIFIFRLSIVFFSASREGDAKKRKSAHH